MIAAEYPSLHAIRQPATDEQPRLEARARRTRRLVQAEQTSTRIVLGKVRVLGCGRGICPACCARLVGIGDA